MQTPTLVHLLQASASEHAEKAALRFERDGAEHEVTYEALQRFVEDLAGGLIDLGVDPGDRVAIWSRNRPEWVIADYATLYANAATVPVPSRGLMDQNLEALFEARPQVVFVDGQERLEALLARRAQAEGLAHIVVMGPLPEGYEEKAGLYSMHEVYARGRGVLEDDPDVLMSRAGRVDGEDAASVSVANTGETVFTHEALSSAVEDACQAWGREQVCASLAPFSLGFARVAGALAPLSSGGTVAFVGGGEEALGALSRVEASLVVAHAGQPERLRERLLEARGGKGGRVERWALGVGWERARCVEAGGEPSWWLRVRYALADRWVLRGLRDALGGQVRGLLLSGRVPDRDVAAFYWGMGVPLLPVYAVPEGLVAGNTPEAFRFGSVGCPVGGVEVRIEGEDEVGAVKARGRSLAGGRDAWVDTGHRGSLEGGFLFLEGKGGA